MQNVTGQLGLVLLPRFGQQFKHCVGLVVEPNVGAVFALLAGHGLGGGFGFGGGMLGVDQFGMQLNESISYAESRVFDYPPGYFANGRLPTSALTGKFCLIHSSRRQVGYE